MNIVEIIWIIVGGMLGFLVGRLTCPKDFIPMVSSKASPKDETHISYMRLAEVVEKRQADFKPDVDEDAAYARAAIVSHLDQLSRDEKLTIDLNNPKGWSSSLLSRVFGHLIAERPDADQLIVFITMDETLVDEIHEYWREFSK